VQGAKAFYNKWVPERQGEPQMARMRAYPRSKLALAYDLREYLQPPNLHQKGLHGTPHDILV
jgi:hypothetical protein